MMRPSGYNAEARDMLAAALVEQGVEQGMDAAQARLVTDLSCQAVDEAIDAMLAVAKRAGDMRTFAEINQMALIMLSDRALSELSALKVAIGLVNGRIDSEAQP